MPGFFIGRLMIISRLQAVTLEPLGKILQCLHTGGLRLLTPILQRLQKMLMTGCRAIPDILQLLPVLVNRAQIGKPLEHTVQHATTGIIH